MKRIYFFLLIIPFFLFSCNDDDNTEFRTNIPVTIPIKLVEHSAVKQKSGQSNHSFSASETYYLNENEDIEEYLKILNSVVLKSYSAEVTGLEDSEIINELEITVTGGDVLIARKNVTKTNNGTDISQSIGVYETIANVLFSKKQITITVTGITNSTPMEFDVNVILQIDVAVEEVQE